MVFSITSQKNTLDALTQQAWHQAILKIPAFFETLSLKVRKLEGQIIALIDQQIYQGFQLQFSDFPP